MKIIDLTRKIYAGMPVFPGDPGVSLDPMCSFEDNVCQVTELRFGSHTGTHLDAPRHFLPEGPALPAVPLETFVGEAICVQAKVYYAGGETHPVIELSDEDCARIRPGDRLIISTGWDEKADTHAFFVGYPIFSEKLVAFLLQSKICMLGVDLPTIESVGESTYMHKALMGIGILPVEGLLHLSGLVGRRFFFSAAPLNLENGDGCPVRAYAMIEE